VDAAGVLSEEGCAEIAGRLSSFTRASNHDAVAVIVPSTAPLAPAEYAFELFEHWKVGGDSKDGVMMLVALAEGRVECVVGPALAPALPDDTTNTVLAKHAAPHLARGDFDQGVLIGVDLLARILEHTEGLR